MEILRVTSAQIAMEVTSSEDEHRSNIGFRNDPRERALSREQQPATELEKETESGCSGSTSKAELVATQNSRDGVSRREESLWRMLLRGKEW